MANAEAMRLSNKAVWGDSVLDALSYYTATSRGVTYEFRENNMGKYQQTQINYGVEKVENGYVVSINSMSMGSADRFVFNTAKDLNQFLASKNLEVFEK